MLSRVATTEDIHLAMRCSLRRLKMAQRLSVLVAAGATGLAAKGGMRTFPTSQLCRLVTKVHDPQAHIHLARKRTLGLAEMSHE